MKGVKRETGAADQRTVDVALVSPMRGMAVVGRMFRVTPPTRSFSRLRRTRVYPAAGLSGQHLPTSTSRLPYPTRYQPATQKHDNGNCDRKDRPPDNIIPERLFTPLDFTQPVRKRIARVASCESWWRQFLSAKLMNLLTQFHCMANYHNSQVRAEANQGNGAYHEDNAKNSGRAHAPLTFWLRWGVLCGSCSL